MVINVNFASQYSAKDILIMTSLSSGEASFVACLESSEAGHSLP